MTVDLWKKIIDPGYTAIIAEAGVNHNGDWRMAKDLIGVAKEAGCDAVKFQTFSAEELSVPSAPKADYQKNTTASSESQREMLKRLELKREDYFKLYEYSLDNGIAFLSTPFDENSVDFLEELGVGVFKIPSGEITNISLLAHIASKLKPIILSTGMSTLEEVEAAIRVITDAGNQDITLMHCVSNYPAEPADANLKAIRTMQKYFRLPVGYSDHSLGIDIAIAAVALGATLIEKHFTLDCGLPGPDHKASLPPDQLKLLVRSIRRVEKAFGSGLKQPALSEAKVARVARKSLVAGCDIKAGTMLSRGLIAAKRPGTGLAPWLIYSLVGRKTKVDIAKDELLTLDMLI